MKFFFRRNKSNTRLILWRLRKSRRYITVSEKRTSFLLTVLWAVSIAAAVDAVPMGFLALCSFSTLIVLFQLCWQRPPWLC